MRKLKTYCLAALVAIPLLAAVGCDYVAPDVSKAQTEKAQVEQMAKQNTLLEEQNKQLKRIADAMERLPNSR